MSPPENMADDALSQVREGLVVLYVFDQHRLEQCREWLRSLLDDDEIIRAQRLVSAADRDSFGLRRGIRRAVLGQHLGCDPREVRYGGSPGGRPHLHEMHATGIEFSASATTGLIAIAVADGCRVGVDVEAGPITELKGLADLTLGPRERRRLASETDPSGWLLRTFACKEALGKVRGTGLADVLFVDVCWSEEQPFVYREGDAVFTALNVMDWAPVACAVAWEGTPGKLGPWIVPEGYLGSHIPTACH